MATTDIFNMTDTWTGGGTLSAIKMTVTDTSSAADSMLIDLIVGSSRMFGVRKDGVLMTGGVLPVAGSGSAGAAVRLYEDTDNGTNYVAIKAPDNLAATYTLTLPSDDGSADQYLKTDGSGNLSWATVSGASAPLTLASGTLTDPSTALTITQTWNDAADTFVAASIDITNTASADNSVLLRGRIPGSSNAGFSFTAKDGSNASVLRLTDVYGGASSFLNESNRLGLSGGGVYVGLTINHSGGSGAGAYLPSDYALGWSSAASSTLVQNSRDISLHRIGAGVLGVRGAASTDGSALNFLEQTAPSAPSANQVVIYAEDNGSGKTRLMARFNTGAAQVLATEP